MSRAPGSPQQPTRRIECLLERLSKRDMTREQSRLALRLAVTAHRAVSHDPLVLENGDRGVECVEWTAAGRERIQRFRIEREARPAVLHEDAGCRQHASGAEFPVERLNV